MNIFNLIVAGLLAGSSLALDIRIDLALFKGLELWAKIVADIYCSIMVFVGVVVPLSLAKLVMNPKAQEIVLARIEADDKATGEVK
jgi:hypothetical protein